MSDAGKAAQSAREVVREALEAFEDWATSEPMAMTLDELADDQPPVMAKSVRRIARAALALRALLAQPPSDTVARLVEAAEAAVRTVMDDAVARGWGTVEKADAMAQRSDLYKEAIAPFRAARALREALTAHRASVDALGFRYPETIARVNAALEAERAKTEAMKKERDDARKERDDARRTLEEQRAVWAAASNEASANHRRIERAALAERDEARKERDALFSTRESDRRMLKNRDEDYEQAAAERDALKTELNRLRADALNVGGDAVRKAYDVCHAALDAAKAPKAGSSGSCAERIAALAAERDEARRERDDLRSDRDENYEQVRAKAPTTRPSDGAVAQRLPDSLSFSELRAVNVVRCRASWHDEKKWTPTDWACALAGEVGEACDVAKKLKRLADGIEHDKSRTKAALVEELGHELADVICYADLLAASLEIDLGAAVRTKFNLVSERVGSSIRLPAATKTEAHDACPRVSTPPPSPAPLDPRAALIAKGAIRLAAARFGIDKGDTDTEEWAIAVAAGLLRLADAEARKGGS